MTSPTADLPPELLNYLATRDRQRSDRADTAWRTLTRFERRVVREAAVMGYVLGDGDGNSDGHDGKGGPGDNRIPPDMSIVRDVIQHCDTTSDRYPYLADACAGRRRRITRKRLFPGEEAAQ